MFEFITNRFRSSNPEFPMRHFGTPEDVANLKAGEAVLIHKAIIQKRFKNDKSAKAMVRYIANGHGARLWVTTTTRGHMLVWRKPESRLALAR